MEKMEQPCPTSPDFERKYKIIVRCDWPESYPEMIDWLDKNSSGLVSIKSNGTVDLNSLESRSQALYIGFENPDDALFFKIKYK